MCVCVCSREEGAGERESESVFVKVYEFLHVCSSVVYDERCDPFVRLHLNNSNSCRSCLFAVPSCPH